MSQEATVVYVDTAALEFRLWLLKFHLIKLNKDTVSFLIQNPEVITKMKESVSWLRGEPQ